MTVEQLLAELTLEEKVSLLAGEDFWHTPAVDRLGIARWRVTDGPIGARGATTTGGETSAAIPCGTALAATWDPALVREVGTHLGREAHAKGARLLLAPTVNLHRHPLAGRNFECFSEDPLLTGAMAAGYIAGVQSTGVGACIKHFACNESEFERFTISSEVEEVVLREMYLRPFEIALAAARPVAVMSAYNRLNGTFCSESSWLLTDVLRSEWGYDGLVLSDWFGTHSTSEALAAGLDVEMPGPPRFRGQLLVDAVRADAASEQDVDRSVARLLHALERTGGIGTQPAKAGTADTPDRRELARRVAREGLVLLQNVPVAGVPVLPLKDEQTFAVLGPCAATPSILGGGSAQVSPYYAVTPLDALLAAAPGRVRHEPGCRVGDRPLPVDRAWVTASDGRQGLLARVVVGSDPGGSELVMERLLTVPILTGEEHPAGDVSATISATLRVPLDGSYDLEVTTNAVAVLQLDERSVPLSVGGYENSHVAVAELRAGTAYQLHLALTPPPGGFTEHPMQATLRLQRRLDNNDFARAVEAAAAADVALVLVGTNLDTESEGFDRESLHLPGRQDELIRAVQAANPRTVVVVNAGAPVDLSWSDQVPAVLQSWFGGQETGNAVADVLLGLADAAGRLPVTIPVSLEDTPAFPYYPGGDGKVGYGEGVLVGYPSYVTRGLTPPFPFGHGLSYTTFAYGSASVDEAVSALTVDVTNTGDRAGSTVLQVYRAAPTRRLVGFAKVALGAGQSGSVTVELDKPFACWDLQRQSWWTEPGDHQLLLATSATQVLQRLDVTVGEP